MIEMLLRQEDSIYNLIDDFLATLEIVWDWRIPVAVRCFIISLLPLFEKEAIF